MDKPMPHLTAALLCERVIQEKDESITLVRIADRVQYSIEGTGLPAGVRPMIGLQGFISIKSGPVIGEHKLQVILENPRGQRKKVSEFTFNLLGKDQGQNVIININLGVDHDGLYWFDVLFDDAPLTKIPLLVTAAPKETASLDRKDSAV
jgi:hypothetical protein